MRSTLWWLGLIFGTLSVVMLIKHGFDYGFVAPLQLVLDYYERVMQVLFGWAEPWLKMTLVVLGDWLGWSLYLYPHWKHVFVLMSLYVAATARTDWSAGTPGFALFGAAWGGLVALASSVAVGAIELRPEAARGQAAFVVVPVAGYVLYELGNLIVGSAMFRRRGERLADTMLAFARYPHYRAAVGLVAVVASIALEQTELVRLVPNAGLVLLLLLVVMLALYWILRGQNAASPGQRRFRLQLGLAMLSTLGGAVIFLASNAGLQLLGL